MMLNTNKYHLKLESSNFNSTMGLDPLPDRSSLQGGLLIHWEGVRRVFLRLGLLVPVSLC